MIDERLVIKADASGPKSARMVLQNPRVDFAVMEVARGGILREGLGYDRNDVAVVTNVAPDHLGLGGIDTLIYASGVMPAIVEGEYSFEKDRQMIAVNLLGAAVVIVGDLGRWEILAKINRLYDGTHLEMAEVVSQQARKVSVEPVDPEAVVPLETDGETPGRLPATFEVLPKALRLRF